MLAAGKVRSRAKRERPRAGATFRYFKRLLTYVWPHKRYLFPALICMMVMALTYSASIGSILPVLKVMVEDEGLHGWVSRYVAEQRLNCQLSIYDPELHHQVEGLPPGTAVVTDLEANSPLHTKAGVRQNDYILSVDSVEGHATTIFRELARGEQEFTITYRSADAPEPKTVALEADRADSKLLAVHRLVQVIPGGRSPAERMRTLAWVLGLLLAVVLIGNVARVTAQYLTVLINSRAIMDLRRQMYAHVLNLPLGRFTENTSDTISKFVQDMNDIMRGLNNFFQKVVTEPFKATGAVTLALILDWKLTLMVMLGAPLAVVLFRKLGKRVRRANRRLLIAYGEMLGRLESTMAGMRVVKGYTRENYERRHLFQIDRQVLRQQLKMGFIEALTSPLVETIGFVAGAGIILYFASSMFDSPLTASGFMPMLVCLAAIFDPVRKLSSVYPKLQRAAAASQRIFELIDTPSEYDEDAGRPRIRPLQETIEFQNVTFAYNGTRRAAVRDVSATIRRGETIAIVGPNGSGKTTLVSLLPRFFPLNEGRILIDGQDTSQVSIRSLRSQFSLITQESVIFPESIRHNIAYGRPEASFDEIQDAARKAFADEFIQELPEGYDTIPGERGATLSGGQRQRIAIARAILRNAPILLFDEATSQVDPESERKIHQALENFLRDRTAFVIAHRYSTISDAHRIMVMDEGRVIDIGTHDELMKSCPLYQRLYETQFRGDG